MEVKQFKPKLFDGIEIFGSEDQTQQSKSKLNEIRAKEYLSRINSLSNEIDYKEQQLNQQIRLSQKLQYKLQIAEDELKSVESKEKKLEFYSKEIDCLKKENRELYSNIIELMQENSENVQISNNKLNSMEKFIINKGLVKSNGVKVRETFIEKLIKENSELRAKLNQQSGIAEGLESDLEECKRFERKRDRKQRDKEIGNFILKPTESENHVDEEKYQILEKNKSELENELLTCKQKWAHEKSQLESEITAFKEKIESIAHNYQSLQNQLKSEKSIISNKIQEICKLDDENAKLKTENKILESKFNDLKLQLAEVSNENEFNLKSVEYYKNSLYNSREEYRNLIKLFTETQEKLTEFTDPKQLVEGPQGITIKKLELKIECLNLINKNLNEQIADSNRLIHKIEYSCVREIERFEEAMRAQMIAAKLILKDPKGIDNSSIGGKSAENLLVENSKLKEAVIEYAKMMDDMKTTISELTVNMEESKNKMELLSNEERRKEKEQFLKIIKNYEQQRGELLNTFTSQTGADYLNCKQENITLKAQIDKLEEDNETITKRYNFLKSQIDTTEKVMKEQIQKKKEMFEENKNLRSQLCMLENRVSKAKSEMEKVINSQSDKTSILGSQDLSILNELKQEIEILRTENKMLKENINALVTSKGIQLDEEKIYRNAAEAQDKEIEELKELQELITKCIDKILSKSNIEEEPHSDKVKDSNKINVSSVTLEDLENTFKDLKECQSKLYLVTESLNDSKIKIHELESNYIKEKHRFMEIEHNINHQNKLLKLQIEEFLKAQRDGKFFKASENAPAEKEKIFTKMKILMQKAQKVAQLHDLKNNQNKEV